MLLLGWAWTLAPEGPWRTYATLAAWQSWDAEHYLAIAQGGYANPRVPEDKREFMSRFPPLYPWLVRLAAHVVPVGWPLAGNLVSLLFLAAASWMLFVLVRAEGFGEPTALWAVTFLNCFPSSYFGGAVYAESLFLFLTISWFYAARIRRSYGWAGGCAALQILTRQVGVALLVPHVAAFVATLGRRRPSFADAAALILPFAAYAAFAFYVFYLRGAVGYFGTNQPVQVIVPFSEAVHMLQAVFAQPMKLRDDVFFVYTAVVPQLTILASTALVLLGIRRVPWEYSAYGLSTCVLLSMMHFNYSALRHAFGLFTLPMLLAVLIPPRLRLVWAAASTALLLFFFHVFVVHRLLC